MVPYPNINTCKYVFLFILSKEYLQGENWIIYPTDNFIVYTDTAGAMLYRKSDNPYYIHKAHHE